MKIQDLNMRCVGCGNFSNAIDCLCDDCRREKYDTKKCGNCGKKYRCQNGWYVPSFESYIDTTYVCDECIPIIRAEHEHKNKRLKEIPEEINTLYKELRDLSDDYCDISRDEEGKLVLDGEFFDKPIDEILEEVKYYKTHESDILDNRNKRNEIQKRIEELRSEKKTNVLLVADIIRQQIHNWR